MGRWGSYWDWDFFPRSTPRTARGGIKAQTRSGSFGRTWWAKRWIAVLESFDIGARLGRGRSYARRGQALSIEVEKGIVRAKVQGSRPEPYDVTIEIAPLAEARWKKMEKTLTEQPLYAARLVAGEMPEDIEKVFKQAGVSLFPAAARDLKTDCSCPDWSNPCKHIAAVYYLLAEEFDRDPFLLFKLRGRTRDELVGCLKVPAPAAGGEASGPQPREPLPLDAAGFWQGAAVPDGLCGEIVLPRVHAALPKRLGNFPFWRGNARLIDSLEVIYAAASAAGLEAMGGAPAFAAGPDEGGAAAAGEGSAAGARARAGPRIAH